MKYPRIERICFLLGAHAALSHEPHSNWDRLKRLEQEIGALVAMEPTLIVTKALVNYSMACGTTSE